MTKRDTDFRGLPLHDSGWFGRSEFVEQYPIENMGPRLEELWELGVTAIKWHQYVPSFNDGEPCEFSVGDVCITTNPEAAAAWIGDASYYEGEEGEEDYPHDDYDEGYVLWTNPDNHWDGLTRDKYATPIDDSHYRYAIEAEFGVNVTVVITPTETYLFEYECGY